MPRSAPPEAPPPAADAAPAAPSAALDATDSGRSLVVDGFSLVVVRGSQRAKRREIVVRRPLCRIGKAPGLNDVVLDEDTVSRQHCEIARDGRGWLLRDLGSTNGTLLDGAEIREAYLRPGSLVTVGNVQLRFTPIEDRIAIAPAVRSSLGALVGESRAIREVYSILEHIARFDGPVLFEGGPGSGKRTAATVLHGLSARAAAPCVTVDCRAPTSELAATLFGQDGGRGVWKSTPAIERAAGGTLVLAEVCDAPVALHEPLLRLVERREWRRSKSAAAPPQRVELRVVATASRPLEAEVERGAFPAALERALGTLRCRMPSLAERPSDVAILLRHFVGEPRLDEGLVRLVEGVPLAGNVADLERLAPLFLSAGSGATEREFRDGEPYRDSKARFEAAFERRYVQWLLGRNDGNISRAARAADMDRKYLHKLCKKHGVEP